MNLIETALAEALRTGDRELLTAVMNVLAAEAALAAHYAA